MDTTCNQSTASPKHIKMLEDFFNDYPAEKAEQLFWNWFVACLKNDFSSISDEELREFSEFYERMVKLELVLQREYGKSIKNKKGGSG